MARTIGVIGMGYVGLTLTAALARKGFVVHGVDVQPAVIDSLNRGRPPIYEPGDAEAFAEHAGRTSDAVPVINDHPGYRAIRVGAVLGARRPAVVSGSWRTLDEDEPTAAGVRYAGLGYLPEHAEVAA